MLIFSAKTSHWMLLGAVKTVSRKESCRRVEFLKSVWLKPLRNLGETVPTAQDMSSPGTKPSGQRLRTPVTVQSSIILREVCPAIRLVVGGVERIRSRIETKAGRERGRFTRHETPETLAKLPILRAFTGLASLRIHDQSHDPSRSRYKDDIQTAPISPCFGCLWLHFSSSLWKC